MTLASEAETLLGEGRYNEARARAMACLAVDSTIQRCKEARIQSYTRGGDYVDNQYVLRHCRSAFRDDLNCLRSLHKWHVDHQETEPAAALAKEIDLESPGSGVSLPDPESSAQ